MKTFPTLYKKSSTGKISQWTIIANSGEDDASYTVEFGYVDGQKQKTTVRVATGKNIGKKNETTPYEQACAEAESKWTKQLDKGYIEVLSTVSKAKADRLSPMLAYSYDDYAHKIKWPCYWQVKIDGCRAMAYRDSDGDVILQSRQGKTFYAMTHLVKEIEKILPKKSKLVLDGELYTHGEEFQELIHLIKRDEPHEDSKKVEYHIYDCYDQEHPELTFGQRLKILNSMIFNSPLQLVKTEELHRETDMKKVKEWAKKNGYEGIMLRNAAAPYKLGHRSQDLLKVKEFQDAEFEIVGAYENKGKMENQCTLVCKTKDGIEFGVKPEGNTEMREWYWKNIDKIKGKMLTVRFFSWTTSKNSVPRFPIGVSVRDYE
jgi:DNA ligase-1